MSYSVAANDHANNHEHDHDHHPDADAMDIFGFWIYIMSDCILFASIFAVFAVLHTQTFGGPTIKEITSIPYVLKETLALLASSFTYGMAILALYKSNKKQVITWLMVTFVFGFTFVFMEVREFVHLYMENHSWQVSAALSSFFTLVGTHGFHVSMGLLWMLVMMVQVSLNGINPTMARRLTYLGLFWAFLDIVWIFVFTIVYLMGSI